MKTDWVVILIGMICLSLFTYGAKAAEPALTGPVVTWDGNQHRYQAFVVSNELTWAEVQADAADRGGYLATVTSETENDFIYELVQDTNTWWNSNRNGPTIGAVQQAGSLTSSNGWQWMTGEPWTFESWYPGEPNDFQGGQNRIQYWKVTPMWDDVQSSFKPFSYVVEYQIYDEAVGSLSVAIDGATDVTAGYPLELQGMLEGVASVLIWDFGDGEFMINNQFPSHAWNEPGTYDIKLIAFNETYPGGVFASHTVHVVSPAEATAYVAPGGHDANDGLSWASAKATIQAGVDAVYDGGTVMVSNGTYHVAQEVWVDKAVTIESLNGPHETIVDGGGSTRCFSLGNRACVLSGFTVTNGYAGAMGGGGILCDEAMTVITNCIIVGNTAADFGGGVNTGTLYDSVLSHNISLKRGGALNCGTAYNCIFNDNVASNSGGALQWGEAHRCEMMGNVAVTNGGGAFSANLYECTIISNRAEYGNGGGGAGRTASRCVFKGNSAVRGGGLYNGEADNCLIMENTASVSGGGMQFGVAKNCTIIDNVAENRGGGMYKGAATNSIVWHNVAGSYPDIDNTKVAHSCIDVDPLFMDAAHGDYRLSAYSPCIDAGTNLSTLGSIDLLGELRIVDSGGGAAVDMGAYEFQDIAMQTPVHYVDMNSPNPIWPFASWATAARDIQSAIDAAGLNDLVLITNGIYRIGSTISLAKNLAVQSVNGPGETIVDASVEPLVEYQFNDPSGTSFNSVSQTGSDPGRWNGDIPAAQMDGLGHAHLSNLSQDWYRAHNLSLPVTNGKVVMEYRLAGWDQSGIAGYGGAGFSLNGDVQVKTQRPAADQPVRLTSKGPDKTRYTELHGKLILTEGLTVRVFVDLDHDTYEVDWKYDSDAAYRSLVTDGTFLSPSITRLSTIFRGSTPWGPGDYIDIDYLRFGRLSDCRVFDVLAYGGAITLEGLTITGGTATNETEGGGGIYVAGGHAITIKNCTVQHNYSIANGGGVKIQVGNNDYTPISLSNCVVRANNAEQNGGGVAVVRGHNVSIQSCLIADNHALGRRGGGVYVAGSGFRTIKDCIISNNVAYKGGGGLSCENGVFVASGCLVVDNLSGTAGGGVALGWSGSIYNSLIVGNRAPLAGGVSSESGGDVVNCIVVGNHADSSRGGVSRGELKNSIVWNNTSGDGTELFRTHAVSSCAQELIAGANQNINTDPIFINPAGGDYRLSAGSPCINWGNNEYVSDLLDLDGNPRIVEGYVDLGCYEYQSILGLTDSDADGLPDEWEHSCFGGNADPDHDEDGDGHVNWCERITGMDPTRASSVFAITNARPGNSFIVEWPAVTGRWYNVLWTPNLTNAYETIEDFIDYPRNSYTDTAHAVESTGFYKVEVRFK